MTRVAGIPQQVAGLAGSILASGPELALAARLVGSSPLPEMPSSVAGEVAGLLSHAQATLSNAADVATREGEDLKRRGLWLEVADAIKGAWKPGSTMYGLVATSNDGFELVEKAREMRFSNLWGDYTDDVLTLAARDENSVATLNAYFSFQETHAMAPAQFARFAESGGSFEAFDESLGAFSTVSEALGRVTPWTGLVSGAVAIVHPEHAHGALMVADRAAGMTTVWGSSALVADGLGIMTLTPGGQLVVVGVLAAAGVYELIENREEVARLTVAGGKFLLHHAYVLAGPEGIATHEIVVHAPQVARAAVTSFHAGEDLADKGATTILHGVASGGESLLHGGVSTGKKILGHVWP